MPMIIRNFERRQKLSHVWLCLHFFIAMKEDPLRVLIFRASGVLSTMEEEPVASLDSRLSSKLLAKQIASREKVAC